MARIYSNENFPRRVVEELRLRGHDVLTSFEAGRANQRVPDSEVLGFATEVGRIVLTLNRLDFIRLHQETGGKHGGIIVCARDDSNARAFAIRIHAALADAGEAYGRLIRVVKPSS